MFKRVRNFVRNVWFFRKELNEYSGFDYQGTLMFHRKCLEGMYNDQMSSETFVSVNRDKNCKRIKETIVRLDRLILGEQGIDALDYVTDDKNGLHLVKVYDLPSTSRAVKLIKTLPQDDLDAVAKFWQKHILHCWE
jgi:hypothetical protein